MKIKFSILISYLLFNSCAKNIHESSININESSTTIQLNESKDRKIMLPKGTKLIDIDWRGKRGKLWFLTRPMTDSDTATIYKFTAGAEFNLEPTYTIIETK